MTTVKDLVKEYDMHRDNVLLMIDTLNYIRDLNTQRDIAYKNGDSTHKIDEELGKAISSVDFDNLTNLLVNTL